MSERYESAPPEYVDDETRLMRDVVTLRVGVETLDQDAQRRVLARLVAELALTHDYVADIEATLAASDDEWRGESCPDCGELHGMGVPHECRDDISVYAPSIMRDIGR
jgi:hypothetical protein